MGELIISIFVLVSTDIVLIGIADTEISSDKIKPFNVSCAERIEQPISNPTNNNCVFICLKL